MQRRLGSVMRIGRKTGLSDEEGYKLPVLIALIVVIISFPIVIGISYYFASQPPEQYNTMYLLDSQGMATNYPKVLIAGQNSTFSVNVNVENHMHKEQTYQVRTKIVEHFMSTANGVDAPPINTYEFTLEKGQTHQNTVTITENNAGNYAVVFELWLLDEDENYVFTFNYCVLDIQVINQ